MSNFDRYSPFKANGKIEVVPFVSIKKKNTDKFVKFIKNKSRLDKISYEFYGDPDYGWLIMQANPGYGSLEGLIPDGTVLRIPYPLPETLNTYIADIISYKDLY
jgi:hypothetical protein